MIPEEKIIADIRNGSLKAFEGLFRTYYQELCGYAYQHFKDKDTAEEIVQDLFYKLWLKKEALYIQSSIRAYLYKAVYNNTMLFLRVKNKKEAILRAHKPYLPSQADEADMTLHTEELDHIIQQTIHLMPRKVQRIFELSRYEGLKYKEIADRLSISVKTVEANMGKALKIFRKSLKEYLNAG